ncbi:MAG: hypothetical protein WCX94_02065 [Candidatus Dojkabacteria bacterium]
MRKKNIDDLTNDEYKSRIYNQYHYIAVPPYSEIDIGYYWYNNTPDTLNIETIRIPMSRQSQNRGDITNLVYDIGFQEGPTYTSNHGKGGKYLDVEGMGLVSSDMGQNAKKGIILETLTVKLPVEITQYEVEYLSEYDSRVLIHVRNATNQWLNNVWVNYKGDVSQIIDLEPYEEKVLETYKRCDLVDNELNCGTVRIIDNNTETECVLYGAPWGNYYQPDSITVFNKIGDSWFSGAQIQPEFESFCIQRTPYTYTTEEIIVKVEPEEPVVTKEQYWEQLLGINILPITSYRINNLERYLTLLKPLRIDTLKVL